MKKGYKWNQWTAFLLLKSSYTELKLNYLTVYVTNHSTESKGKLHQVSYGYGKIIQIFSIGFTGYVFVTVLVWLFSADSNDQIIRIHCI